jgi:gamma-glutamylputrescine oxidase
MISIWEKETVFAPQDVLIAGSGFAGLWSAFYLKRKHPKAKITVLEKSVLPAGASTRNAGFACFGSLSEVVDDIRTMGLDKTLQVVELRYRGLQKIEKHFSKKELDLDWCGGYELFHPNDKMTTTDLRENIDYLNSLLKGITGHKKTYSLDDDKIKKFGFGQTAHIVKNKDEGYLHSGKLMQALLQNVQSMGVQVLNGIEIKSFEHTQNSIIIKTDQPYHFTASQLLICTNAFAQNLLPSPLITPARGQVLLTSPIANLPWNGTFHYDEGFYYFRNLGNRVLLGGARNKAFEEERTTSLSTSITIQKELERFLREVILPYQKEAYTIEMRWSGIMGMGQEKMPVVKEMAPNVFCALGTGGMGVAIAPEIGQQAANLLMP